MYETRNIYIGQLTNRGPRVYSMDVFETRQRALCRSGTPGGRIPGRVEFSMSADDLWESFEPFFSAVPIGSLLLALHIFEFLLVAFAVHMVLVSRLTLHIMDLIMTGLDIMFARYNFGWISA